MVLGPGVLDVPGGMCGVGHRDFGPAAAFEAGICLPGSASCRLDGGRAAMGTGTVIDSDSLDVGIMRPAGARAK
jgi:hypothetical protein